MHVFAAGAVFTLWKAKVAQRPDSGSGELALAMAVCWADHPDGTGSGELSELVRLAKSGDLKAFEQIIILHQRRVFLTALGMLGRTEDAQDAAQEVFFRLYRHLGGFDESRGFAAWLYRVTVNVCRDIARSRGKHELPSLEALGALEEAATESPDPSDQAASAQEIRIVQQALERLPGKERAAVVLRDIEGLSTREVARILGSSQATVRSQISAARLKIRRFTAHFLRGRP